MPDDHENHPLLPTRDDHEANRKTLKMESYARVRLVSSVIASFTLIALYFSFRNSKLYQYYFWFHKADKPWLTIPILILHSLLVLLVSLRPPIRVGFVAGLTLRTLTELCTLLSSGFIASEVTRSRVETYHGFNYYIVKCSNPLPLNLTSSCPAEVSFAIAGGFGCQKPYQVAPPSSNLVDGPIVMTHALLALYSVSLATLVRPGLSFAITPISLHLAFLFLFHLFEESGFICCYMLALVFYTLVLLGIQNFIHSATEAVRENQPPAQTPRGAPRQTGKGIIKMAART